MVPGASPVAATPVAAAPEILSSVSSGTTARLAACVGAMGSGLTVAILPAGMGAMG